ncbi:MAG: hypothetical protein ACPLXS_00610 [Candidatus Micrarchaeales archaeon]
MHQVRPMYLLFLVFLINFVYSNSYFFLLQVTYEKTINQWLPLILIAGILALGIVGIVYAIASAFNIEKLKTYASSEIPQVIATILFASIIVIILKFGSMLLISYENSILPQESLQKVCENIKNAHSSLNFFTPSNTAAYGLDAIYGFANTGDEGTPSICDTVSNPSGREPYYFLASSEIILLNNTVRLINFSNSIYVLHTVLSFFKELKNEIDINPVATISFSPYAGFDPLASAVKGIEADIIGYISFNFISITLLFFIYRYWVTILIAGILLRTFSFTRKLGGFLIAFVISTIFITPLIYFLTYSVITKTWITPLSMNPDPSIKPVCPQVQQNPTPPENLPPGYGYYTTTISPSSPYTTSLAYQGFCGCFWQPYNQNILFWEVKQFFLNLGSALLTLPSVTVFEGYSCNIDTATAYVTFLGSSEFMGKLAVETYLFPLISFFVTLANIIGLSWLFGGTTRIFGIEKLVG